MKNGEVKFYNRSKQFGFVKDNDSEDEYFFHHSVIEGDEPSDGQAVQFEGEQGDRGLRATKVVTNAAAETAEAAE